tara:strand:+ start:389 stop:667 length:279 start_codon:yes stop_codon:yes gene_type:complete
MIENPFSIQSFLEFLKSKKVVEGSIMFAMGALMRNFIYKVSDNIITPLSKGEFKKLKEIKYDIYFSMLFGIIISSYVFYLFYLGVDKMYDVI